MNKKLIRLTESDLHRIVKESVHKIINEIGDTEKGQDALGQVHGRAIARAAKLGDKGGASRKLRNTASDAAHKAYSEAEKNKLFAGIGSSFDNGIDKGYHKAKANESRINRVVKESVDKILSESDYWREAEDNYLMREKLPRGWERIEREDDEPIYRDPDFNEYVKNEYGRFVPLNNEF